MPPQNPSGERDPTPPTTEVPETLSADELDAVSGGVYTPELRKNLGTPVRIDLSSTAGSKP